MKQMIRAQEKLKIELYDEDGNILEYRETYDPSNPDHVARSGDETFSNDILVDGGIADIVDMIATRYSYVSVGTGTTTPEHDDTELEAECMSRSVAATSILTTFFTDDTVEFRATFDPVSNYTIAESGIHLASGATGDIMLARETFTPISAIAGQSFTIAWQIILMR